MTTDFTGSDAAVQSDDDDKYGYKYIAAGLADSIVNVNDIDGLVIGIEGQWGSGKTSLLNLLTNNIADRKIEKLYTLNISPWAGGNTFSIVSSLLIPVANIINNLELSLMSPKEAKKLKRKNELTSSGKKIFNYLQKTSGATSSFLDTAGMFIPGLGIAGKVIDGIGKVNIAENSQTIEENKKALSEKIKELNIRFIIMIDDLDRLEPSQAVEVVRLVKSVANFPHFTYIMCYDKNVLSHAVEKGLNVKNGLHYLQKIIQVTFAIPLPEVFDLRNDLRDRILKLHKNNNENNLNEEDTKKLDKVIDVFGERLSTPREVKSICNSLTFHYSHISKNTYFPDLCFLFIIKSTQPNLYNWIENYLRNRSVVATRDAFITTREREDMGKEIKEILPDSKFGSNNSIHVIAEIIPGLQCTDKPEDGIFCRVDEKKEQEMYTQYRLGSPAHYRFYFAFSAPKNVLPEEKINNIIHLAESDDELLKNELMNMINNFGVGGRTWFEYFLDKINKIFTNELTINQTKGFLRFFFNNMDEISKEFLNRRKIISMNDIDIKDKINYLLLSLKKNNEHIITASQLLLEGKAYTWIIGIFFRNYLWDYGLAGDRKEHPDNRIFSVDEIVELKNKVIKRFSDTTIDIIHTSVNPSAFLYGWADLMGYKYVQDWFKENDTDDDTFLDILLALRSVTISDRIYYPLHKSNIENFFDYHKTMERLAPLESPKAVDVKKAIELSRF
ncbi:KAP family P-loop NTPase fold protein [Budvicia aquatica]|uniref:KAP family P-loop NTPase fold protein n=1 Tax=Budvicia aquatica TaxID=82979 RepID=UPI002081541D|nr:KAP family NTPase [Budvicia aquatica]GKX50628.1 phage T7 exclusion protein [Budvicia aquatica]